MTCPTRREKTVDAIGDISYKCVTDCSYSVGYYWESSESLCKMCHNDCLTCTSYRHNNCVTCKVAPATKIYFYSTLNKCVSTCPAKTFKNGLDCIDCDTNCSTCIATF